MAKPKSAPSAKKQQQRQQAFSKPATGQFTPGAASKAQTGQGVPAKSASKPVTTGLTAPQQTPPQQSVPSAQDHFADLERKRLEKAQQMENVVSSPQLQFGSTTGTVQTQQAPPVSAEPLNATAVPAEKGVIENAFGLVNPQTTDEFGESKGTPLVDFVLNSGMMVGLGSIQGAIAQKITSITEGIAAKLVKPGVVKKTAGAIGESTVKTQSIIDRLLKQSVPMTKTITTSNPMTQVSTVKTVGEIVTRNRFGLGQITLTSVLGTAGAVATLAYGGENFSEWFVQESLGPINMALTSAQISKDFDSADELFALRREALSFDGSKIPFVNVAEAIAKYKDLMERQSAIAERMNLNARIAHETGTDLKTVEREQRLEDERKSVENFNRARLETEERIAELRREGNEEFNRERLETEGAIAELKREESAKERVARRREREEEARFWEEQKRLMFELEAKEREAQAKYWLDYAKMKAAMEENNSRSRLGFGLFR